MKLKIFKILICIFSLHIILINSSSYANTSWITKKNENQINKNDRCNTNLSIETINLKSDYFIDNKDYKNAFVCAVIGSDKDNGYAIANLGWHYQTGNGIKKDYKKANKLFKKGIKKNNLYSYNRLAESFINGWGVPKNLKKAISLFKEAADKGDDFAQGELGYYYLHGEGVIKDEKIAFSWFKKSADQNNTFAQSNLGWLFLMGKGVEINYEEAFKYSKLAADKGDDFAQANVGYLYEFGEGVEKDIDKAIEYYSLSANQENEYAKGRLDILLIKDDDNSQVAESTFITKKKKDNNKNNKKEEKNEIENIDKVIEDNVLTKNNNSFGWITKNDEKAKSENNKTDNQSQFVLIDELRTINKTTKLRKEPSVDAASLQILKKNSEVWALKKLENENILGEWIYIEIEDQIKGYVLADKLEGFVDPKKENESKYDIEWGKYYAIVIGNNDYILDKSGLSPLKTAINDAEKIGEILENKYGFEVEVVPNVTRSNIYGLFTKYRNIITDKDNLLIYYAGHGQVDPNTKEGYWQTIGGKKNDVSTWLSMSELIVQIGGIKAKHVIVIADSCFSGSLFNEVTYRGEENELNLESLYKKKNKKITRVALSSGSYELVPDSIDGSDHSPFANSLINILESNEEVMLAHNLYSKIEIEITKYSRQTPVYGEFDLKKHQQAGDFIFVPKNLR